MSYSVTSVDLKPKAKIRIVSESGRVAPLTLTWNLTEPLKEVRRRWCEHQELYAEQSASTVLCHRNCRLFDVITCRSLGFEVDSEGCVSRRCSTMPYWEDRNTIELSAVTAELPMPNPGQEGEPRFTIFVRAKGGLVFKLCVRHVGITILIASMRVKTS